MASESIDFNITAHDRASREIKNVGQAAGKTAAELDAAAASMALFDKTTQLSGKAARTSEAAFKQHAKAAELLADAENVLAGRATVTTKLFADQGRVIQDTGKKAAAASDNFQLVSKQALTAIRPMGLLVAGVTALAPQVVTLGLGLGGLGLAAAGMAKPILDASQATGGLRANLGSLDPAQQSAAKS